MSKMLCGECGKKADFFSHICEDCWKARKEKLVPVVSVEEARKIAKSGTYLCMRTVELNWKKKLSLKEMLEKIVDVDDWIEKQLENQVVEE